MYYYLYKIENKINGKIYIGVHKTKNMNDNYMGSGKVIRRAIKKYGIENFEKTIIETFSTQEEMLLKEKEIVTEEFLEKEHVYNLRRGGRGGFDYINKNKLGDRTGYRFTDEQKNRISNSAKASFTEERRKLCSENAKNFLQKKEIIEKRNKANKGKPKSDEHKQKISEAIKKHWETRKKT